MEMEVNALEPQAKESRVKQLYKQCSESYWESGFGSGISQNGIPKPSDFDDSYNVPAELLFIELCKSKKVLANHWSDFSFNLMSNIHNKHDYDFNSLTKYKASRQRLKTFRIYFQLCFQLENIDSESLFNKQLTINEVTFRWCSQKNFSRIISDFESGIKIMQGAKDILQGKGQPGTYLTHRNRLFPTLTNQAEKSLRPVVATVSACNYIDATNRVVDAVSLLVNSANISLTIGSRKFSWSGGNKRKPNISIAVVELYLVDDTNKKQILFGDRVYDLPSRKVNFSKNGNRKHIFNKLIRSATGDCVVSARIRKVIRELSLANNSTDRSIRQLSYWRCLELATAKCGSSRKEKEIIKIFQNYYINKFWKQMGDLILSARNTYVHQGVQSSPGETFDHYVNWSQQYSEKALMILLSLYDDRTLLKTEGDVDKFFDYYSESNESLKVAGILLARRRRTS